MKFDLEKILNRKENLFFKDFNKNKKKINKEINNSSFLIIGAAGSIGQSVSIEIFKRNPKKLHLVDISENNMVELVRTIRSSAGYIKGEFKTYELDVGSIEFEKFFSKQSYDYIFNFSALKHVRSEKDPYTLMRMFKVNILNPLKILKLLKNKKIKKFFNVSTDKASEPANMMGASKRLMELALNSSNTKIPIVMARFANVLFSDGSLPYGFSQRLQKEQPITAPNDIKRYFITSKEAAYLCIISSIFGKKNEIFYPKLDSKKSLISFSNLATKFLRLNKLKPILCKSEKSAREFIKKNKNDKLWPYYLFNSDTTGEKAEEIFYSKNDNINEKKFIDIGVIKSVVSISQKNRSKFFLKDLLNYYKKKSWNKNEIIKIVKKGVTDLSYEDKNKYLNNRM